MHLNNNLNLYRKGIRFIFSFILFQWSSFFRYQRMETKRLVSKSAKVRRYQIENPDLMMIWHMRMYIRHIPQSNQTMHVHPSHSSVQIYQIKPCMYIRPIPQSNQTMHVHPSHSSVKPNHTCTAVPFFSQTKPCMYIVPFLSQTKPN